MLRQRKNKVDFTAAYYHPRAMRLKEVTQVPAVAQMRLWLIGERSQTWLAHKLKVSRPTVYRWFQGENAADPCQRRRIHDLSRAFIHFDDWYTETELRAAYEFSQRTLTRRLKRRNGLKWRINIE